MKYPLYCPKCEAEQLLECEVKDYDKMRRHRVCPVCSTLMERDFSKGVAGVVWSSLGPGSYYHEVRSKEVRGKKLNHLCKKSFKYGEERLRENQRKDPETHGSFNDKAVMKNREEARGKDLA